MIRSVRVARFTASMGAIALLAGCVGAPGPSSTSAAASREPLIGGASATAPAASAPTNATPGATDGSAPEGAIVIVVADELRLRAEPGIDGAVLGSVERGTVARITEGPIEADGFRWYDIVDTTGLGGWAAAGDETDPWLSSIESTEDATPLLTFEYGCDAVGPFNAPSTVVLSDARVIMRDSIDSGAFMVRRLSPAGMAHLQETVLSSPYLRDSAEYTPVQRTDAPDPPGHGLCVFTFTVGTEAEPIVVRSVSWFGEQEEAAFYEPAPERKTLDAIAHNLMVIDSVLDESLWEASGWLPYVADEYFLWVGPGVSPAPAGAIAIEPSALPIDVDAFGEPTASGRCGPIGGDQAFELARILNHAAGAVDVRMDMATFLSIEIEAQDVLWPMVIVPRTPQYALNCDAFSF